MAAAYVPVGRKDEALKIVEDLKQRRERQYFPPLIIAHVYIALADADQAFEWVERAYQERDGFLLDIVTWPCVDSLRSDARFTDLITRIGL